MRVLRASASQSRLREGLPCRYPIFHPISRKRTRARTPACTRSFTLLTLLGGFRALTQAKSQVRAQGVTGRHPAGRCACSRQCSVQGVYGVYPGWCIPRVVYPGCIYQGVQGGYGREAYTRVRRLPGASLWLFPVRRLPGASYSLVIPGLMRLPGASLASQKC